MGGKPQNLMGYKPQTQFGRNQTMQILRTIPELRRWSRHHRANAQTIGLVPTMGALHAGHASLIRAARASCGAVAVSIFVNPTQFAPNEDLARYPRSFDADCALAQAE